MARQQLSLADIQRFLTDKLEEGKTLEYKRDLIDNTSHGKKEFLKDVTSLANTAGGYLIFGIEEKDGLPVSLVGVPTGALEQEILRLESLLRTGVDPRLPGVEIYSVSVESKSVVVVGVERSWLSPHRVTLDGHAKFYAAIPEAPMTSTLTS